MMKYEGLTERELQQKKELLTEVISRNPDKNFQRDNKDSEVWKNYAMGSRIGKQVYRSFSDEELLAYIRAVSTEINHAPSQRELFWVLREYIKCRFRKWPYALRAAGLTSSAGPGGKTLDQQAAEEAEVEDLLRQVREKAAALGRLPHPKDMPEVCAKAKRYYSRWGEVIAAAKVDEDVLGKEVLYIIEDLEPEYVEMLAQVKADAVRRGRSPVHGETDLEIKRALIRRCGSWRNALYQVGLTPVMRRKPFNSTFIDYKGESYRTEHSNSLYDCFYQVLNLSDRDKTALAYVERLYRSTGKIPLKEDVSKELRKKLQSACGTWVNALFQIGIAPADYYDALKRSRQSGQKA